MENYLHPAAIKAVRPEVDITFGDFDDVPLLVAKAVHNASPNHKPWEELTPAQYKEKSGKAKKWLNKEVAQHMTPALLDEHDPNGEVRGWLNHIAEYIDY